MLAVRDAITTNSRNAQQKFGELVNQGRHAAHKRHYTSCRRHAHRDRTTRWEAAKPRPSIRLDTGAYKEQEPPHTFRRGQRTRSVSCPHHNSSEVGGASWGLRKTWQ